MILKSGKSESITINISVVKALIVKDGGSIQAKGPQRYSSLLLCLARSEKEALKGTYVPRHVGTETCKRAFVC